MSSEINFVNSIASLQDEYKIEVMPVQVVYQVLAIKYILHPPDAEPARMLLSFGINTSDRNFFHALNTFLDIPVFRSNIGICGVVQPKDYLNKLKFPSPCYLPSPTPKNLSPNINIKFQHRFSAWHNFAR